LINRSHLRIKNKKIKNMNQKNAFTLIEMLVVIAMIGILSTVLLVAINPSRTKAKDARVASSLNQIVALGQSYFNPLTNTYDTQSMAASNEYTKLSNDITSQGGSGLTVKNVTSSIKRFAVYVTLPSGAGMCADSVGIITNLTSTTGTDVEGYVCQK
jgi:prepilin-type N-terminal cleavage/methylation domain-containing protein